MRSRKLIFSKDFVCFQPALKICCQYKTVGHSVICRGQLFKVQVNIVTAFAAG
jgi:hypothetical protein